MIGVGDAALVATAGEVVEAGNGTDIVRAEVRARERGSQMVAD
jgi:hypothetical protein